MKQQIQKLKQTLKKNAKYIRELKAKRKEMPNGYVPGLGQAQTEFRIGHIAYCLIRGRKPEEIENHWRDPHLDHKYVWKKAEQLKQRLEEEGVDETLCAGA